MSQELIARQLEKLGYVANKMLPQVAPAIPPASLLNTDPDEVPESALVDYHDYAAVRKNITNNLLDVVKNSKPISNSRYEVRIENPYYREDSMDYNLQKQKKALHTGQSLSHKMHGTYVVKDLTTGQETRKDNLIMNVPYLTDQGTYIRNGVSMATMKQLRLLPNAYTRKADDGTPETQFNVRPGTGSIFKLNMDPAKSVFYMRYKGKKIPLYPVLRAMGHQDDDLQEMWGKEIFEKNKKMEKSPHAINFLKQWTDTAIEAARQARFGKKANATEAEYLADEFLQDMPGHPLPDYLQKESRDADISYGCAMSYLDTAVNKKACEKAWKDAIPKIPKEDLHEYGVETEPHVTILYGLHTDKSSVVKEALDKADIGFYNYTIGEPAIFENEDYDVLIRKVRDPRGLKKLRKELLDLPHTLTYKDYKPHATIAYLKKGKGKEYLEKLKKQNLPDINVMSSTVLYSNKGKDKTSLRLRKKKNG